MPVKYVWVLVMSLVLSGCSDEKRLASLCKKVVDVLVRHPDLVKFEKADIMKSGIQQKDLEDLIVAKQQGAPVRPSMTRMLNLAYQSGEDLPMQYWVDINFTAPGINDGKRSSVSCRFVELSFGSSFLSRAVVAGRSYDGRELLMIMMRTTTPNDLSDYL